MLKRHRHEVEALREFVHGKDFVVDGKIEVQVKISSSDSFEIVSDLRYRGCKGTEI